MARILCLFSVLALLAVALALPSPKKREVSAMDDSSSQESSEESSEEGYMQRVRETCRNNSGSDEAFNKLSEATQKAMNCAMSSVDMESFLIDIDTLSNETRTTFFNRYCPQMRTAHSCLNGLVAASKPCLEDAQFVIVEALPGIVPDAIDLICKNDGDILFKMNEPKYKKCSAQLNDAVKECVVPLSTETNNFPNLTEDQCSILSSRRECVQQKLNECNSTELISLFDLFYNKLFRMTPCQNYANPPAVEMTDNNTISEA